MSQLSLILLLPLALLLAVSSTEAVVTRLPPYRVAPSQDGLTRLFFNSRLTRNDPKTSMSCFAGYIFESSQIAEQYSGAYSGCLAEAQNSRLGIDKDFLPTRRRIERSAESVCKALRVCSETKDTLDSFNCHSAIGSNNTVATYAISGNASESASLLQERYRLIDLHHVQCTNKAERNYIESTASNYNYLQGCLDGKIKPKPLPSTTSSSSSTTTTTTTTTTTEAPTTTSTEPPTTINLEDEFKQLLNLLN
ncbi:uncharacterized protein LOC117788552 [Drosophila innubila]|uniref:uncharacterized protein LOC117788552 n=1 Tax=Drosophila innubila TaxID=198719 RepID=UPI00148C4A50|nr:uncharacterized protein LOC117788552 [Drosophila innubila]